jgi:hypothetical protein
VTRGLRFELFSLSAPPLFSAQPCGLDALLVSFRCFAPQSEKKVSRRRPESNRGSRFCRPVPKPLGHGAALDGVYEPEGFQPSMGALPHQDKDCSHSVGGET